jgi:hypothetical protein
VFEPCVDVPFGGVLCALPALLANGLLHALDVLGEVRGYYTRIHVLLTLAVMPRGETVEMRLAERGTLLGRGEDAVWVKEVRKLTETGHQTAVISSARGLPADRIAPQMFTRWCQENFFA